MVNFVIVVDANRERRQLYIEKIKTLLPLVDGLKIDSCSSEDFCCAWAAGLWTPISYVSDSKGTAIVFGEAIEGSGSKRLTAEQVRDLWTGSRFPEALDGFHAAAVYNSKGIMVGADLLGTFPIYYYSTNELVLVGSSPELFRYHPCFRMELNPVGLVGILLTNALLDGQTLLSGVKRLAPGHLLLRRPEETAQELSQYSLPVSRKYFELESSEQVEVLDQVLQDAITRHLPTGRTYSLLLSGGLDSRLLGGYLKENNVETIALTDGLSTDIEMGCAIPVARELGFRHIQFDVGYKNYPIFAGLAANWSHLGGGNGQIFYWGFYPHLRKIASRVVSGYFAEVLGGYFRHAIPKSSKTVSFETIFTFLNNTFGIGPETLRKLLKVEYFDDLVSKALHKVKKVYENYPGLDFQRIWCYSVQHYSRFHTGGLLWPLSFGSWPVLPFADRKVLETAAGMPLQALLNRRCEKELLCKKFPSLARLPLVGPIYDIAPLVSTARQRSLQQIYGNTGIWRFRGPRYLRHQLIVRLQGERRYYSRLWDINSPGWRDARAAAEPYSVLLQKFADTDMVRRLMPSPNSSAGINASALKVLIAFSLWLKKHRRIEFVASDAEDT